MRKTLLFFFLFVTAVSYASEARYPASYYESLYKRIEAAVEKHDKRKSDFWTARYLGASSCDPASQKTPKDLDDLLKKKSLTPSSFLSDQYDPEFLDWFVKSSYANWAVPEEHVREKSWAYEVQSIHHGDYFLTLSATPEIQAWFVSGNDTTAPLILAPGSYSIKPQIYSGKLVGGEPMIYFPVIGFDAGKRGLLYVWPPEFYDLDNDGIPEIWLRYNLTSLNGFSQVLAIYKIENDNQLVLFKKFKADPEGVARRLEGNKIQLGWGVGSKANIPHMSYDQYHFETLEFVNGDFKKISEETKDHILKNNEWKKYYIGDSASPDNPLGLRGS